MRRVLFVCVGNSGRSQMAEALFNHLAPPGLRAESAGTNPASAVAPSVILVLSEVGIDWHRARPKRLTARLRAGAERVISMGCDVRQSCPANLMPTEDWELPDPRGAPLEDMRALRDDIQRRVQELIQEMLATAPAS